jgi:hypothetical protein
MNSGGIGMEKVISLKLPDLPEDLAAECRKAMHEDL